MKAVFLLVSISIGAIMPYEAIAADWGAFVQGFANQSNQNIQNYQAQRQARQQELQEIAVENQRTLILEEKLLDHEIQDETLRYDHELHLVLQQK